MRASGRGRSRLPCNGSVGLTFLQQWSGTSRIVWHPLPVLTVKVVLASHSYLGYSSLPAAEITPLLSSEKYQEMRVRRTDPFRLCRVRIMHVLEIIPHSAKKVVFGHKSYVVSTSRWIFVACHLLLFSRKPFHQRGVEVV